MGAQDSIETRIARGSEIDHAGANAHVGGSSRAHRFGATGDPPREPKLYTVTGVVRKIKRSDDETNPDCDLHLERAASGDQNAT